VVSDDGGVLAASAMAIGLALASADIQMFDVPLAATVLFGSRKSTTPILDPTAAQCKSAREKGGGFMTVIALPSFTQIGHVLSEGVLTLKQTQLATEIAFKDSLTLYSEIVATLKASL